MARSAEPLVIQWLTSATTMATAAPQGQKAQKRMDQPQDQHIKRHPRQVEQPANGRAGKEPAQNLKVAHRLGLPLPALKARFQPGAKATGATCPFQPHGGTRQDARAGIRKGRKRRKPASR